MSKTVVRTKVYEIRQSSKGWSGIYQMYFDRDKALAEAARLQAAARDRGLKTNFRVWEHTTGDVLVWTEND